jgi:hypothetical protein
MYSVAPKTPMPALSLANTRSSGLHWIKRGMATGRRRSINVSVEPLEKRANDPPGDV